MKKEKLKYVFGFLIGIVNGMFGSGGGLIAVPLLKKLGFDEKKSHQNAIAVILPVALLSAIIYSVNGNVDYSLALKYIPFGIIGSVIASVIMKKIKPKILRKVFGAFMIYAGVRLMLR